MKPADNGWKLYILKCSDGTLYTGITTNLDRRVIEHNTGKGAKYTRGRGPVEVVYFEKHENRSSASKAEAAFKKLTRNKKLEIVNKFLTGK